MLLWELCHMGKACQRNSACLLRSSNLRFMIFLGQRRGFCYHSLIPNTYMNITEVDRRLKLSAISLAVVGVLFFFYGILTTDPQFSLRKSGDMSASLMPTISESSLPVIESHTAAPMDSNALYGVLFAAMILMVAAAAIDVWRRLHRETRN